MGEFVQSSFLGGMNLLLDDTRLAEQSKLLSDQYRLSQNSQYRLGLNSRNRYDVIDPVASSIKDNTLPIGIKQEIVTFGNYIIAFVSGKAYYRYYTDIQWTLIPLFGMSPTAPRYWTCQIPLSLTRYIRLASTTTVTQNANTLTSPAVNGSIQLLTLEGAAQGNNPGLLVQDNINQPLFIYIDPNNGFPTCRQTQSFSKWMIGFTDATNVIVGPAGGSADSTYDLREYVPIGSCMAWVNGVLFIVGQDGYSLFRSVSGRPLDFMVNVTNLLSTTQSTNTLGQTAYWQFGGGDATTTSYSVGVGGITCIRALSSGGLFVAASNANFAVTFNTTPNAPTIFGEYTFIRTFLFNATCLSDRTIFDSLGDTKFIDLNGIRSFNAIQQLQNEGRNSVFSANIALAFKEIIQDIAAAILYNNYEFYAVNTVFGPCIAVWDTLNSVWVALDTAQTNGKKIKIFAKIELAVQALYAITEDDEMYQLYASDTDEDSPSVRLAAMCSQDPKREQKITNFRCILTNITKDYSVTCSLFVNNRFVNSQTQKFSYVESISTYAGPNMGPDIGTQTNNILFSFPDSAQGWKAFVVLTWTGGGSLVFVSMSTTDIMPMQPLLTQSVTQQS